MFVKAPGGTFTAIDFDARRARIVQVELTGKRIRVRKMHAADVPAHVRLSEPQALGVFLGSMLKEMRLQGSAVLMHVPRGQAVLKPLSLPRVDSSDELPGMVRYQVEKELPFSGDQAVIDFTLENHFDAEQSGATAEGNMEVLVAAVHQKVVEHYRQIAEAAGVKIRRLGLRPYANMCCTEACRVIEPGHSVAMVHITADETEIDVFSNQSVRFSRAAVVKVFAAPPAVAEGEAPPSEPADPVEQVVTEVTRSLKSYQAVQRGQSIRRILVAGDTGIEAQVATRLSAEFDTACERFAPAKALELADADENVSAYVSAFGLAIGQGGNEYGLAVPFDFLNPKKPIARMDPRKRKLIFGSAAAAILLFATTFFTWSHLSAKRAELNAVQQKFTKLEREVLTNKAALKRADAVDAWVNSSRDWLGHWAQISTLFPQADDAYITSMRASSASSIDLALRARTNEAITALGERLAEKKYEFKFGPQTLASDPHGYIHSTSVRIMIDPAMKIDVDALPPVARPANDDSQAVLNGERRGGDDARSVRVANEGDEPRRRRGRRSP